MRRLLAGNWKMNGLGAALAEIRALERGVAEARPPVDIVICPPTTLIAAAAKEAASGKIAIGGQDCHAEPSGAYTGDIAAEMLRDAGASYVIIGHSERRQYHRESDEIVSAKFRAARRAGLRPILCVGETEIERDSGRAVAVVTGQLAASIPDGAAPAQLVVAYEPVWAIGSGRTPSLDQVAEIHAAIRTYLESRFDNEGASIRILYGGSVKPGNAAELLAVPNVGGALVGGASLKAADFLAIILAAPGARTG